MTMENNLDVTPKNEVEIAQKLAQTMQEEIEFVAVAPSKKAMLLLLLEKIPLLASFLHAVDATGLALSHLAYIKGSAAAKQVGKGFQFAGILIASIDFVRIPMIYLGAWILGQKKPISLTKSAKWLYSGVLIVLLTVALVFPTTAAFIGLAVAGLALGVSVLALGRYFYDNYRTKKDTEQITTAIERAEKELKQELQQEAGILFKAGKQINPEDHLAVAQYRSDVEDLKIRYEKKTQEIQSLYDKRYLLQQKQTRFGWAKVMDKAVGVGLSGVALIGMLVTIFVPPIGFSIVLGAAVLGGCYLVGRVGIGIINKIIGSQDKAEAQPASTPTATAHESTKDVMSKLFGHNAEQALHVQIEDNQWLEQAEKIFVSTLKQGCLEKVLSVFQQMAHFAKEHQASQDTIMAYLKSFENNQSVLNKFNNLLIEKKFSHQLLAQICDYQPFKQALLEGGVTYLQAQDNPPSPEQNDNIPSPAVIDKPDIA